MKNNLLDVKKLRLAQVRYFNEERMSSSLPRQAAYAFLVQLGDAYFNVFNPTENLPVYDRVPYTNVNEFGEEFGNMISLVYGEIKDGPCYILQSLPVDKLFEKDTISFLELENYMINSSLFFVDRIGLIEDSMKKNSIKFSKSLLLKDFERLEQLNCFFEKQGKGISYRK